MSPVFLLLLGLGSASCFSPAAVRPSLASARLLPSCARASVPYAQAEGVLDAQDPEAAPASLADKVDAVYKFSRPHTIRGTLLACFTGVGRALVESPSAIPMIPSLLPRAMLGVLSLLLGNLFIVGINQIYDVEIDQINKPFLPVAAGRISPRAAWALVVGSGGHLLRSPRTATLRVDVRAAVCAGLAGLALVKACFSPLIFYLYLFGTTVGGLYSVPPFQVRGIGASRRGHLLPPKAHRLPTRGPASAIVACAAQALPAGGGPHHRHLPRVPPQLRCLLRHARGAHAAHPNRPSRLGLPGEAVPPR
jgi:hypothetical protein